MASPNEKLLNRELKEVEPELELKGFIMQKVEEGVSISEIHQQLLKLCETPITEQTVRNWIRRWKDGEADSTAGTDSRD